MNAAVVTAPRLAWRAAGPIMGERDLIEEVPVALRYDGAPFAVLMASPADLHDLAVGFTLTEGIAAAAGDIDEIELVPRASGVEARIWLGREAKAALAARRRHLAGASGCGLCGIESIEEATRPAARVAARTRFTASQVSEAVASLDAAQPLGRATRAAHAAGWWEPNGGLVLAREDVGRHNALDKLAGAIATRRLPAREGIVVLSSRVSAEMIQKAARIGAGVLAAVSAPTALACRMADAAGLTLVAVARADGFELFTQPDRIRTTSRRDTTRPKQTFAAAATLAG